MSQKMNGGRWMSGLFIEGELKACAACAGERRERFCGPRTEARIGVAGEDVGDDGDDGKVVVGAFFG